MICMYQIAESLDSIFKSENRVVDKSIVLDKNAESFPYHLLDNLVRFAYTYPYVYLYMRSLSG